jgi:hypothetical protein
MPDSVEYTDGTPTTVEQYAKDVSAFMMWVAEPKLEERKNLGFRVMIFLIVFALAAVFHQECNLAQRRSLIGPSGFRRIRAAGSSGGLFHVRNRV